LPVTNVDDLPLPEHWRRPGQPRRAAMLDAAFLVDVGWWNAQLADLALPGGPVVGIRNGHKVADGRARLSRREIFALDQNVPDATLRRLWYALAWGTGTKPRLGRKRLEAVTADIPAARQALETAARQAHHLPKDAYTTLFPHDHQTAVKYLGPAFFTKFLYFSPGATARKQSPILDARVAHGLHTHHGWHSLRAGGRWPAATYDRYCRLLTRWAQEATTFQGREVWPDELEQWLFANG
jgi:8-oxoguanine DNA glycosylase-like protein